MTKFGKSANKDYQKPGTKTPSKIFKKRIEETEYMCMEKGLPFCRACAWNVFNDNLKIKKENIIRDVGVCYETDERLVEYANKLDIKQFVGADKFNLLSTVKANELKLIDGSKLNVQIGWHLNYNCNKSRMHNCCVFMTLTEFDSQKSKKKATADAAKVEE